MRTRALVERQAAVAAANAAARRRQQLAQPSAALVPLALQEQAAEMLAERVEDALCQPPYAHTAGSLLQAQQNSRLAQLLSASAAGVMASTGVAAACRAAGRVVPPCWLPAGALAGKLQAALQQCGNQLAEACQRLEGLLAAEEAGLWELVEALHSYQRIVGSTELAQSLLGWVSPGLVLAGAAALQLCGRPREQVIPRHRCATSPRPSARLSHSSIARLLACLQVHAQRAGPVP